MKPVFQRHLLLFLFLATLSLGAFSQKGAKETTDLKTGKPMLIGKIKVRDLIREPYSEWFKKELKAYKPDRQSLKALTRADLKGIKVEIIMATWCGDTRRELPRFIKIFKRFAKAKHLRMIGVDRTKTAPGIDLSQKNIERVPTFIFYREDKEIGRIVESPAISLEKDMIKILTPKN
jgi:hypothetical protein